MPRDDGGQGIHDRHRRDARIAQGGRSGVSEPEPAHNDVEPPAARGHGGEAEITQGLLGHREEARHEVLVAELDLEDVAPDHGLVTPPKSELAHGRLLMGEFLEAEHQAMRIIFLLTNSSIPSVPSSRPEPERLMPPKGSSGLSASTQLT